MAEQEYRFEGESKEAKKNGFAQFLWNGEKKEFLGRSGSSWAKISLCYSIFYFCLASFFIGMLAVFFQIMPMDKPTYFAEESVMARKGPLNPGLGFRPQIDVEDKMIKYSPQVYENGFKVYSENLNIFLNSKYSEQNEDETIECVDGQSYEKELREGKSCKFNYDKIFAGTNCTALNKFGYNSNRPCVLLKLNKIVDWVPVSDTKRVTIKCEGTNAVDVDNLRTIVYHSEGNLNADEGYLSTKFYPFYGQKSYRAPFVFAEFNLVENVLINIRCRAFADNIDNTDNTNMRGQTSFTFYVDSSKN